MATHKIGIIMNGVTGRMGTNQHLVRSIVAIRNQGGIVLPDGTALMPDPILVGRNEAKLEQLAEAYGNLRFSTDLIACLADQNDTIYFDDLGVEFKDLQTHQSSLEDIFISLVHDNAKETA